VDSAGQLRQPFRLGLGGVVGGKAATANKKPAPTITGAGVLS
jgi:hypothetical protein